MCWYWGRASLGINVSFRFTCCFDRFATDEEDAWLTRAGAGEESGCDDECSVCRSDFSGKGFYLLFCKSGFAAHLFAEWDALWFPAGGPFKIPIRVIQLFCSYGGPVENLLGLDWVLRFHGGPTLYRAELLDFRMVPRVFVFSGEVEVPDGGVAILGSPPLRRTMSVVVSGTETVKGPDFEEDVTYSEVVGSVEDGIETEDAVPCLDAKLGKPNQVPLNIDNFDSMSSAVISSGNVRNKDVGFEKGVVPSVKHPPKVANLDDFAAAHEVLDEMSKQVSVEIPHMLGVYSDSGAIREGQVDAGNKVNGSTHQPIFQSQGAVLSGARVMPPAVGQTGQTVGNSWANIVANDVHKTLDEK
ncbi:hypothetical protein U1Q18_040705, partial [Sarracenia purpurea var. burkii]